MPAVAHVAQKVVSTGLKAVYTAVTVAGVEFPNDGKTIITVKNAAAGASVVTVATPATFGGLAVADLTVSIPAGEEHLIGPFPVSLFNDANGNVGVTASVVTTTTMAVLRVPAV